MQRTPGMYTAINTQTQRTGLPTQNHSIVFMTNDVGAPTTPKPIYDTATADVVSGANSNAGRMISAALSVSQGVRVETMGKSDSLPSSPDDSDIQCTPSGTISTFSIPPDAVSPTQITIARNGGIPETIVNPDLDRILLMASDGTSYAFFAQDMFGLYPAPVDNTLKFALTGLSAAGVVMFEGSRYDPRDGFEVASAVSQSPPQTLIATDIVAEVNTITILPTLNAAHDDDFYYQYGGNDAGDPVVLISCAKAIVKTAPATDPMPT